MGELPSLPTSFTGLPWTHGISGAVFFISDNVAVKRALSDETSKAQLAVERRIYERLYPHPRITALLGVQEDMLLFERLQCTLRHRLLELRSRGERPERVTAILWARQTAEALEHVHARGVKQVDIGTYNVLLHADGSAKLCDFAGSSIDGSEPTVAPSAHASHPALSIQQPSVHSELFAFSSMLYEVETTLQPFHDKDDAEVEALFGADQFPPTDHLVLGQVIQKCWMRGYSDAGQVVADIASLPVGSASSS